MALNQAISFITGTGRCGSVTLANILSLASNCVSLHEGTIQGGRELKISPVPSLIKLNLQAYLNPDYAEHIIYHLRKPQIEEIFRKCEGINHFCETAYYFAPFLRALCKIFPESKLVVVVRNGKHFVRSAYSAEIPDRMPIGYVDDREFTKHEMAVAAGRLRPKANTISSNHWDFYSPFQKNCWLWADTNRIILEGAAEWPNNRKKLFRFEDLFEGPETIRPFLNFLEIDSIENMEIKEILSRKMNAREKKAVPPPDEWKPDLIEQFDTIAGPMMKTLGYI